MTIRTIPAPPTAAAATGESLRTRIRQYRADPVAAIVREAPHLAGRLRDPSVQERTALAGDPACPQDVQCLLALDDEKVVRGLLENPGLCDQAGLLAIDHVEAELTGHARWFCLLGAALNPGASARVKRRLLPEFATLVAMTSGCPTELLPELSRCPDYTVRALVAGRPALPADDLLRLVTDPHHQVAQEARSAAARRDPEVARRALLLVSARPRRRMIGLMNRRRQAALARDPDPRIRRAVAGVTDDIEVLTRLAGDTHGGVRRGASARLMGLLT